MPDIFELTSEVSVKKELISQFFNWWSDEEIRTDVIPNIVDQNLKDSIDGALKNYFNIDNTAKKNFAEILYDLVGQNFSCKSRQINSFKIFKFDFRKKIQRSIFSN